MIIPRKITENINKTLHSDKTAIILYGPRQTGKTTLLNALRAQIPAAEIVSFNGEELETQKLLSVNSLEHLQTVVAGKKFLFIDEAQHITNIGLCLKIIYDNLPVRIVASGSSSFDLANKLSEPLTGRSTTFLLHPIAVAEVPLKYGAPELPDRLENFLRFGMYPKIFSLPSDNDKIQYLNDLVNTYLYKDTLAFETVRKPKKIIDLLALLALQIGHEVAISELAQNLSMSKLAVEKYLDILEKMFVIYNLRGLARNLRKEISKTSKYYFADLGLRNALIRNFNPLALRSDAGAMFENWFIMERVKALGNARHYANFYFWRTYDQQEIDLVEERDGRLTGWECKWSENKKTRPPRDWQNTYPGADYKIINPKNCWGWLLDKR